MLSFKLYMIHLKLTVPTFFLVRVVGLVLECFQNDTPLSVF